MSGLLEPTSLNDLVAAVRSVPHLLAVGSGTKPRLTQADVPKLSLRGIRGMVEYEPDEFTFTARAGTLVQDLAQSLGECGQYLPFDPLLLHAGATLGGTVAAGLNGPGRFRYGGLRDFILGVRFVDGSGRLLQMGGKVVKNAAGFDLPKFFVGSLGRFGVLAELTFKVFPRPAATCTLRLPRRDVPSTTRILLELARGRWELDALDVPPTGEILARLNGPPAALPGLANEILRQWPGELVPQDVAEKTWHSLREFHWAHPNGWLAKVTLHPHLYPALVEAVKHFADDELRVHLSAAGNVAYVSLGTHQPGDRLQPLWRLPGIRGLTLRGHGPLWWGESFETAIQSAVKTALDPQRRFPDLDAR